MYHRWIDAGKSKSQGENLIRPQLIKRLWVAPTRHHLRLFLSKDHSGRRCQPPAHLTAARDHRRKKPTLGRAEKGRGEREKTSLDHFVESVDFVSIPKMSNPAEYYQSLPPITKAYGTICFLGAAMCTLGLLNPYYIALRYSSVFYKLEVWRLITNLFFLGKFSINFGIRLLMIARYGVQLEKGPFDKRTADFLWMMIFGSLSLLVLSAIPGMQCYFLGISMVFMLLYVWSREFPNSKINVYGIVRINGFYLPWMILALDVIFGSPMIPDLLGIFAGHLYYFLTVMHPLATGRQLLKTPAWVHKLVDRWIAPRTDRYTQSFNSARRPNASTSSTSSSAPSTGRAFTGRSYRLSD